MNCGPQINNKKSIKLRLLKGLYRFQPLNSRERDILCFLLKTSAILKRSMFLVLFVMLIIANKTRDVLKRGMLLISLRNHSHSGARNVPQTIFSLKCESLTKHLLKRGTFLKFYLKGRILWLTFCYFDWISLMLGLI